MIELRDLTEGEFRAWCPEGVIELRQLLLFRWDPDQVESDFPSSIDHYENEARSLILGLRMGDDRERFDRRMRSQRKMQAPLGCDDASLNRLWNLAERWLPRSLGAWWPRYVGEQEDGMPDSYSLLGRDDLSPDTSVETWIATCLEVTRVMADEARASRFREDDGRAVELDVAAMLGRVRGALGHVAGAGYRWSTEDLSFVVRVCQDSDVHIGSRVPLDQGAALAASLLYLRE